MLNEAYERYRTDVTALLNDLHALTTAIQDQKLGDVVNALRLHVSEPFLFVVVGEIKAGKSSFINALLQTDICRVDPAPCTDTIQQIVYAPEHTETSITPLHKRIGLPAEVLRQVSIVDTPGTNTIIEHHHEITAQYIPNSGLVLFVFPAKNPHTKSAWDLLDYIREEWRKRVVFVLQQADLATEAELRVNLEKVREYAGDRGITSPLIFTVSAKWEQENDPRSGFDDIRAYIRDTITGGKHLYLKLFSTLETGEGVLKKIYDALRHWKEQLDTDRRTAREIEAYIQKGRKDIQRDINHFIDSLTTRYDRIGLQIRSDFEEGLSVIALYKRAIRGTLSRKKSISVWLESLQHRFETQLIAALEATAGENASEITDTIQGLTEKIIQALKQSESYDVRTTGKNRLWDANRTEMVREIRRRVSNFTATDLFHDTLVSNPAAMPNRLVSGSTLTLVGAVLLTTHVTLLDITGGILAGLGLFITGGVLVAKRGRILKEFNQAVTEGRDRFQAELSRQLTSRFDQALDEITQNVSPFTEHISARDRELLPLMEKGKRIQQRLKDLVEDIRKDMGDAS